jgi:beta-aspartyl-peptidase (threonine type)
MSQKIQRWLMAVVLGSTAHAVMAQNSSNQPASAPAVAEIRAVMQAQQEAWNRGDIDAFMIAYANSDTTVFLSGDETTRGWQPVRDRYKAKYSDRTKMGKLTFSDLEIQLLGTDAASVIGRWKLDRAQDQPHGRFSLIFRKTPDGWRIVQDHTSSAN